MPKIKAKITERQMAAVDNVLSGKFKSLKKAVVNAGYAESTAESPKQAIFDSQGVEKYLSLLDDKAKRKFNLNLKDLVMERTLDGLDATKLYGKNAIEHPDWNARFKFIQLFSQYFGWSSNTPIQPGANQYNFFMFSKTEQEGFNSKFKDFLGKFYKSK